MFRTRRRVAEKGINKKKKIYTFKRLIKTDFIAVLYFPPRFRQIIVYSATVVSLFCVLMIIHNDYYYYL